MKNKKTKAIKSLRTERSGEVLSFTEQLRQVRNSQAILSNAIRDNVFQYADEHDEFMDLFVEETINQKDKEYHSQELVRIAMTTVTAQAVAEFQNVKDVIADYLLKNVENGKEILEGIKRPKTKYDSDGEPLSAKLVDLSQTVFENKLKETGNLMDFCSVDATAKGFRLTLPIEDGIWDSLFNMDMMYQSLGYPDSGSDRGTSIYLPWLNPHLDYDTALTTKLAAQQHLEFGKILARITNGGCTDYTKGFEFTLPMDTNILRSDNVEQTYLDDQVGFDYVDTLASFITELKFKVSPVPASVSSSSMDIQTVRLATDMDEEHPADSWIEIHSLRQLKDIEPYIDEVIYQNMFNTFTKKMVSVERPQSVGYMVIDIPKTLMQYLTQSKEPRIQDALHWATKWHGHAVDAPGHLTEVQYIKPMDAVRDDTATMIQRPRTENNVAVSEIGDLMYIPEIDEIGKYYEKYLAAISKNSDIDPSLSVDTPLKLAGNGRAIGSQAQTQDDVAARAKLKFPKNHILFVDWAMNILTHTNGEGNLAYMDLGAYRKPTASTVWNTLNKPYYESEAFVSVIGTIQRVMMDSGKTLKDFLDPNDFAILYPGDVEYMNEDIANNVTLNGYLNNNNISAFISWVRGKATNNRDIGISSLSTDQVNALEGLKRGNDVFIRDMGTASHATPLHCIGRAISFVNDIISTKGVNEDTDDIVVDRLTSLALMAVFAGYANNTEVLNKVKADSDVEAESHKSIGISADYIPEDLFFLEDFKWLPHQLRTDANLAKGAKNAILPVDAGGGKTPILLADAFRHMGKEYMKGTLGGIRRPLLLSPKYLMKNYIEDCNFMTKGRVNVICISTETLDSYGEDKLRQLIVNAPVNTIVVADMDFFKWRNSGVVYGDTVLNFSANAEFMRQFDWIYLSIDESHFLANENSQRSEAVQRITPDVEVKRLATGTFIHGDLTNAMGQCRQLDPTALGSKKDFMNKYAKETRNGKVLEWKDEAGRELRTRISQFANLTQVTRKEWASLLPTRVEEFHKVDMTEPQTAVYKSILSSALDEIKKDKKLMKKLMSGDEGDAGAIEMMLRPYIQRLEKFLAAPNYDPIGMELLENEDAKSPKAKKVVEIIRNHQSGYTSMDGGDQPASQGKILVFTSYIDSARAIYESLPEDLKSQAILYFAENKAELITRFTYDDRYTILIGVEDSLNTGHNFQFVTRLIRIEYKWNPGDIEQAESRLNRPDPKNTYAKRTRIYYDNLMVDGTIDVTKASRLISKLLYKVRFDEANNHMYNNVPNLPLIPMVLDSILNNNQFGDADSKGGLWEYLEAYQELAVSRQADYDLFDRTYKGPREPVPVKSLGMPKGSRLINTPYIEGISLPDEDELGILNMGKYLADKGITQVDLDLIGQRLHTEYGDGEVTKQTKFGFTVKLDNGTKISVKKLATFVILEDRKKSVKERLAKRLGLQYVPIILEERELQDMEDEFEADLDQETEVEEIEEDEVPSEDSSKDSDEKTIRVTKPVEEPEDTEEADGEIEFSLDIVNGMLMVRVQERDDDITPAFLKKFGFRPTGGFMYAEVPTHKALKTAIEKLNDNFKIGAKFTEAMDKALAAFQKGKKRLFNMEAARDIDIVNFYKERKLAVPVGSLRPYVTFDGDSCYLMVRMDKQPSAKKVKTKVKVPTVTWEKLDEGEYFFVANTKKEIKDFIKEVKKKLVIINEDEILDVLKDLNVKKKKAAKPPKMKAGKTSDKLLTRYATARGTKWAELRKSGTDKNFYIINEDGADTDIGKMTVKDAEAKFKKFVGSRNRSERIKLLLV